MDTRAAQAGNTSRHPAIPRMSPTELKALLASDSEFALLDVRETGAFSAGQIFGSVSLPLSHLETRTRALVPNMRTQLVLIDAGDGLLAGRAAEKLHSHGYRQIAILDGGTQRWQSEGQQLFSGLYVPNKAFGECVEHAYGTPHIDAATLMQWEADGKDTIILDSRPYEEFEQFSLPNGINCPGAELVHRAFGLLEDRPETTIVINCAGRTRGIIGAQSLINAGIRNPVVTLKDGTAGWYLNGGKLREGATDVAPPPTLAGLQRAAAAAEAVARRHGVQEIDEARLEAFSQDADRTLFMLDVRTPEEYAAGHRAGSRCAPGGQVVQSTEHYVGVRGARLVLVDDNGIRARMTASWLVQLGWKEVYVLRDGLRQTAGLVHGPEAETLLAPPPAADAISVADAYRHWREGSATFIDVDNSLKYRREHVPGAWFMIRSRLDAQATPLQESGPVIVLSADGGFAAWAADDLRALTSRPVRVLDGGTRAWKRLGYPMAQGLERMAAATDDVWYGPYDFDDLRQSMNDYLSWEVGLVEQLAREDRVPFAIPKTACNHD